MDCITEVQLRDMFEDRLAPTEREPIEAHLSACATCRRLVVEVARGIPSLEDAPPEAAPPPPPDVPQRHELPGATLAERYVILDIVGLGGMGVVYAAYDRKLDRKVALKLLRPDLAVTGDAAARLVREAQVVARLSHPNIINVHDVGETRGRVFIDMEFVDGCTLRQWLARSPRPRTAAIVRVFLEAGRGLAAAHAAGVVHRDFKPDNVLIGSDGRIRVNDFGLARALAPCEPTEPDLIMSLRDHRQALDTRTTRKAGTPAYMAPEQRRGEPATAASDQYAFCVALHEALFGERPVADGAGRSRIGGRERIRNLRLTAAIQRGLGPDPRARFRSMDALIAELSRAVRPQRWPIFAMASVAACALGLVAASALEPSSLCQGAELHIREVWNEPRKAALAHAFTSSGAPGANTGIASLERILGGYTRAWTAAHRESCEATHVFHELSNDLLDRRMTCLRRDLAGLDALLDALLTADAAVVDRLPEVLATLRSPAHCITDDTLLLQSPAPPPALRERIDAHQTRVDKAAALSLAGRPHQALELAKQADDEAAQLGFPPSEHNAAMALGNAQMGVGTYADAERSFWRALRVAESFGLDGQAFEAWRALAWSVSAQARYDEAAQLVELAEAKVNRLGDRSPLGAKRRSDVVHAQAELHLARGRPEDALAAHRQALALRRRDPHADPTTIASSLNALGNLAIALGDADAALVHHREALKLREQVFGPDHPRVAGTLNNIGRALQANCAWSEARASFARALAIRRRRYGRDHAEIASVLTNLAALAEETGRLAEADAAAGEALAMLTRLLGEAHPIRAGVLTVLARIRLSEGAVEEALADARAAVDLVTLHLGAEHPDAYEPLLALGDAQRVAGRTSEAVRTLEQARVLATARPSPREWRARIAFSLARALADAGEVDRARAAANEAQAAIPACREFEAASIAGWLASDATPSK